MSHRHVHALASVKHSTSYEKMAAFSTNWNCDGCSGSHLDNSGRARCIAGCDFDLCSKCFQNDRCGGCGKDTGVPMVGSFVSRGPSWEWQDQDGGEGNRGEIVQTGDWCGVKWSNKNRNSYRMGADGKRDLKVLVLDAAGKDITGQSKQGLCGVCWRKPGNSQTDSIQIAARQKMLQAAVASSATTASRTVHLIPFTPTPQPLFPILDAALILGVKRADATYQEIKTAFHTKVPGTFGKQKRDLCLAYEMLTSKEAGRFELISPGVYQVKKRDIFYFVTVGDTEAVVNEIKATPSVLRQTDSSKRTLLYLAARNGYCALSKAILTFGSDVNSKQSAASTPLHAASYYGHKEVVGLLLEHGANIGAVNTYGNTAEKEARSVDIGKMISESSSNVIEGLFTKLHATGLSDIITLIKDDSGDLIAKRLRLPGFDRKKYQDWVSAWHGTKFAHLESIAQNGLAPPGTTLRSGEQTTTMAGHIKRNVTVGGIKDWAGAVFVSPSIFYAGHVVYAERVTSGGKRWSVLVECYVRPGSFSSHPHTLLKKEEMPGEPVALEYRVEMVKEKQELDCIYRVNGDRAVHVASITFVATSFLEEATDYSKIRLITEANSVASIRFEAQAAAKPVAKNLYFV